MDNRKKAHIIETIYDPAVVENIRNVPGKGRPLKVKPEAEEGKK